MKKRIRINNRVSKKKNNFIIENYKASWSYLKESKKFIYWIIGLFFFFTLFGYFIQPPQVLYDKIIEYLKQLISQTEGMSQKELIWFIFSNNLNSSFFGLILGFFFGIFPVMAAIANGYMLGFVGRMSVATGGISSLWRVLPHGVFELPAIFMALGLGLKLGASFFTLIIDFFKYYSRKNRLIMIIFGVLLFPLTILISYIFDYKLRLFNKWKFSQVLINSLRIFLFIIIPLLIIAGIIEGSLIFLLK
ncbi:MAG: stage II sporulation protein M [Nanoarchaeota archaeon]